MRDPRNGPIYLTWLVLLSLLMLGLSAMVTVAQDDHGGTPTSRTASCAQATPVASPTAQEVAGLGTPVTQDCLTVILMIDKPTAGPRTLTVEVQDNAGGPVTDATVVINTRSLMMDHGTSSDEAMLAADGTYVAEQVSLGMSGAWEVEIVITQPGQNPVAVPLIIELEGPS